jgi:hypothetical protein
MRNYNVYCHMLDEHLQQKHLSIDNKRKIWKYLFLKIYPTTMFTLYYWYNIFCLKWISTLITITFITCDISIFFYEKEFERFLFNIREFLPFLLSSPFFRSLLSRSRSCFSSKDSCSYLCPPRSRWCFIAQSIYISNLHRNIFICLSLLTKINNN